MTKTTDRISRIRKRLSQIPAETASQMQKLLEPRGLLRGYVYRTRRRCGKPSCHCRRGELHEAWVVATRVDGQPTTRSLGPERRERVQKLAESYRRFRQAQSSLRRLHAEAMGLTQELEQLLCEDLFKRGGKR